MKKIFSKLCSIMLLVCMLTSIFAVNFTAFAADEVDPFANSVFKNYITREGHTLYDGDEVFRFPGFSLNALFHLEEGGNFPANEYEMRDVLETARQLGMKGTRIFPLSFKDVVGPEGKYVGGVPASGTAMVEGPGVFNESAFRAMDKALQLANEYGVRLMIGLIDGNEYNGGIANIAAWRGGTHSDAWKNNQIIEDTKAIFTYVLNRTNYYTGVKYKDDPAVMCWQIGNEMERYGVTDEWVSLMAEHIKSIDQNHLVAAPQNRFWRGILDDENIDIVDGHMYDATPFYEFLEADAKDVTDKKALVYGELGFKTGTELAEFLRTCMEDYPQVAGACVFALQGHNRDGGMYRHGTSYDNADKWVTYNYPGFDNERTYDKMEEKILFDEVRKLNYEIRGEEVPQLPVPATPKMLPFTKTNDIRFRGSAGATGYNIERAESENGPWTLVGEGFHDNIRLWMGERKRLFEDTTAEAGKTYWYRVKAVNESGESDWSEPRKLGDTTLDAELQAEKDEYAEAVAAGSVTVEIPTVEGELETAKPEVAPKANLPENIKAQLNGAVVLKIGDSTAFVDNKVKKIDPDRENIVAFTENDRTLVPVRFLAEAFGCVVNYEESTQQVMIGAGIKTVKMQIGSNVIMVGDLSETIDQPAILVDDARTFAPLRAVCELALDKTVLYKDGIIIVYDGKSISDVESEELWTELAKGFENPIDNSASEDATAIEDNLLINGGFETADMNDGWTAHSPLSAIVGEDSHSGLYSWKTTGNGGWKGWRQMFKVEKDTDYVFSFYAKAPKSLQTKDGLSATFKILDEARSPQWLTEDMRLSTSDAWKQYYFEFNSKSQSNVFINWAFCNGTFYVDDFICVRKDSAVAAELKAAYDEQQKNSIDDLEGKLLVDDMEDFSKIYSYSKPGGWRVFTDNPDRFDGDMMRIARTVNETKEIVYKVENMHNFKADIPYCENFDGKFYISADGEEWTEIEHNETQYGTSSNWVMSTFTSKGDFPTGTNYLKIEFGPNNKDFWSPTIKRVEIY